MGCPVARGESWVIEWHFQWKIKLDQINQKRTQPSVVFQSTLDYPVSIFWVPGDGSAEAPMGDLLPGPENSKSFDSFPGHVFHVRDAAGNVLKRAVVAKKMVQQVEIHAESEL